MESKQEQSRKQNNLITRIKYNLNLSLQEKQDKELNMLNGCINTHNMGWLKKMDSIFYIYIFWTIHCIWMIYITFERGDSKISNTITRALI